MKKIIKYLMLVFTIITVSSCKNEKQTPKTETEIPNRIEKK